MHHKLNWAILLWGLSLHTFADGLQDNVVDQVRPVPPKGIQIEPADRVQLENHLTKLESEIEETRNFLEASKNHRLLGFMPDVEIFHKAVSYALQDHQFYRPQEVQTALDQIQQAHVRLEQLKQGLTPWTEKTGLVFQGYRSRIDGSVQPYGLVVPDSYTFEGKESYRLDFWFHGRGEKLTELDFIRQRQKDLGPFTPKDTIVLHLYGRYCNANKFAGEIDLFEALEEVKRRYRIDENRLVVRGFSMGGAACWQFAVHYAGLWAAAAPGAGFSETADFLKVFQNETLAPTWYEMKLWHMYDCTDYALNLYHCPTVAYSGEVDRQKQAADIMEVALQKEGMDLVHLIGPGMGHQYYPDSKIEIDRRLDSIASVGRNPVPDTVRFTTYTLRYNKMYWVTLEGLEEHLPALPLIGTHLILLR